MVAAGVAWVRKLVAPMFTAAREGNGSWDHAAGVLTTQLAGGLSKMLDDQDYNARQLQGYLLSASSQETWDTVATILRPVLLEG